MTVECFIGPEHNLLATTEEHCCRLYLPQPTLSPEELAAIRDYKDRGYKSKVLDATFPRAEGVDALGKHIVRLCEEASKAVTEGFSFLILSDRAVSQERVHIPALMAVGAVHHYLTKNLQRTRVGIISDSGEPREVRMTEPRLIPSFFNSSIISFPNKIEFTVLLNLIMFFFRFTTIASWRDTVRMPSAPTWPTSRLRNSWRRRSCLLTFR